MECQELRLRLRHEEMNRDQKRFLTQQLMDCENRLRAAESKDSLFLERGVDYLVLPGPDSVMIDTAAGLMSPTDSLK